MYESLFDKINFSQNNDGSSLYYSNSFESLFEPLSDSLEKKIFSNNNLDTIDINNLILNPTRLIRGLINYKFSFRESQEKNTILDDLILDAINLTKQIYLQNPNSYYSLKKIEEISKRVSFKDFNLMDFKIIQKKDKTSWNSYNSRFTLISLLNIKKRVEKLHRINQDIFLIPLAHGSVPVAFDLYLRYIEKSNSTNSIIYPIRFSRLKYKDTTPVLSSFDLDFISSNLENKFPVIFEEDLASGKTLEIAYNYFTKKFSNTNFSVIYNNDIKNIN